MILIMKTQCKYTVWVAGKAGGMPRNCKRQAVKDGLCKFHYNKCKGYYKGYV